MYYDADNNRISSVLYRYQFRPGNELNSAVGEAPQKSMHNSNSGAKGSTRVVCEVKWGLP